ncbi:MAG: collagen triple helix repeat-containing protein [Candidatus Berkelbacteria bacterium Licking1014_96]|uniref:Collagen triple helix repeat-containing protein n=1 Tax=Candidatus Berkelbacteria bacterium Licking1014_96 TaxID=2017149 RepID=A0A554LFR1_9BACT|nr:MAG: collagen triple helix repeat-containing protein [Candidatus Berkelbacteria bacterium Licking1014_96]
MAQEVKIDAGANVKPEGGDPPATDPRAVVVENQPQPQAGPQGSAGERGQSGAPGQNGRNGTNGRSGRNGHSGRDGHDGRPGKNADLKGVAKLVQAGDTKVEKAAKLYTDDQVGNERAQRIAADAKKKEAKKKVEHIGIWAIVALLGIIVGYLIRGRNASTARRSGDGSVNAANDPAHVRRTGEALGIPDFPRLAAGPVNELVIEWTDDKTGEQRRYRRATTDPPTAVAGYPDAQGAISGGGNAALAVAVAASEPAESVVASSVTTDCVVGTRPKDVAEVIADATKSAGKPTEEEPAEADKTEV